jgi:drug/metabolite transporter (DMT)-like permease
VQTEAGFTTGSVMFLTLLACTNSQVAIRGWVGTVKNANFPQGAARPSDDTKKLGMRVRARRKMKIKKISVKSQGYVIMFLAALLSAASTAALSGMTRLFPPFAAAGAETSMGALLLFLVLLLRGRINLREVTRNLGVFLALVVFSAGMNVSFILALKEGQAASVSAAELFGGLLLSFLFDLLDGKRRNIIPIMGIGLFTGLSGWSPQISWPSIGLAFVTGLLLAARIRITSGSRFRDASYALRLIASIFGGILVASLDGSRFAAIEPSGSWLSWSLIIAAFAAIGVAATAIPQLAESFGSGNAGMTGGEISSIWATVPLCTMPFAWAFLGEVPTWWQALCLLAVGGLAAYSALRSQGPPKKPRHKLPRKKRMRHKDESWRRDRRHDRNRSLRRRKSRRKPRKRR